MEIHGKHPPARLQQSFSNASDPLVFPYASLKNDLKNHDLLTALAVAVAVTIAVSVAVVVAVAVAVASLNN